MNSNLVRALRGSPFAPERRRFVQGLAAGGVMLGLSSLAPHLRAATPPDRARGVPELSGTEFNLEITELPVNFTGNARMGVAVNGSIPAPTLRWREGDEVTIRVTNKLRESTSIHWHGIILPYQMDGVPGISFPGIPPGTTFTYRFKVQQSGTYWYHSHSGMQEQAGMYGALIIEPREADRNRAERDYVMVLSDWTDEDPMRVFSKLKARGDVYNINEPTAIDFFRDVSSMGMDKALERRRMFNKMRMNPTDLGDLSAATLTYLLNGTTPAGNWTGLFRPGERVRLRFVNGAANTFYDVRIPGLKLRMVQVDGIDIDPVTVDEFRFGPGETYDAIVEPKDDAYTVFAQSMERTGYAHGTLAVREGLQAAVPSPDPLTWLTPTDMHGLMGGGGAGMDHAAMGHGATGAMAAMPAGGAMNHAAMGHGAMANPLAKPSTKARHTTAEYTPSTDMHVDTPRMNLDDPGIGLRNNGRRVLTLADLHTVGGALDKRMPGREIELHLTGNMERYAWSIDGLEFGKSTPVTMRHGERVRVILHNDTMMTHPMHLHGMWSDLENADGQFVARRHTIPVQPAQRVSFVTTPDVVGRWAWHCHLLLHMDSGMFREVVVA